MMIAFRCESRPHHTALRLIAVCSLLAAACGDEQPSNERNLAADAGVWPDATGASNVFDAEVPRSDLEIVHVADAAAGSNSDLGGAHDDGSAVADLAVPAPDQRVEQAACGVGVLSAPSGTIVTVSDVNALAAAVSQANGSGNTTILLKDGTYRLSSMLIVSGDGIAIRGLSGNREAVVVRGDGMNGGVSHVFNVSGSHFTAADMTVGWVANHAIQIHGEQDADDALIHNVHFVDTYEQMLKISYDASTGISSDHGVVEGCLFDYSAGVGPQYYIGGVDAHQAKQWVVRHNIFRHIRSPDDGLAEFAIHFWSDSVDTVVEGNIISDCDRGIGFGMGDRGHLRGIVSNNMVHTTRDVGIDLESSPGTMLYNNTLFTEGYPRSIEYRFAATSGVVISNNLCNAAISDRGEGGSATLANNLTNAQQSWFVAATSGDLHLVGSGPVSVVDRGTTLTDVSTDIDCQSRPGAAAFDIGADEL